MNGSDRGPDNDNTSADDDRDVAGDLEATPHAAGARVVSAEHAPKTAVRRLSRVAKAPASAPARLAFCGAVPPSADSWGIRRRNKLNEFEELAWAPPGSSVELRSWPLAELHQDEVQRRWGGGDFDVSWWTNNGRRFISRTKVFGIKHPDAPAAPAPATPPAAGPALSPEMQQAFALMAFLDQQATGKLAQLGQMAQMIGGGGQQAAMLEMMRQQGEQFRELLQQQRQQSDAQMRAITRLIDDGGEDDGAPAAAAAVAQAAIDPDASGLEVLMDIARRDPAKALSTISDVAKAVPEFVRGLPDVLRALGVVPPSAAPRRVVRTVSSLPQSAHAGPEPSPPSPPQPSRAAEGHGGARIADMLPPFEGDAP